MKKGSLVQWTPTVINGVIRTEKGNVGVITEIDKTLKKAKVHWAIKPRIMEKNNTWVYLRNVTLLTKGMKIAEIQPFESLVIFRGSVLKKLYCDMDGVLVDFAAGALKLVNTALKDQKYASWKEYKLLIERLEKEGRNQILPIDLEKPEYRGRQENEVMPEARNFMKVLIAEAGSNWWATLPWMPGGKRLWENIAKYNPRILSAPMDPLEECEKGKQEWIDINLVPIHQPCEVVFTDEKFHLAEGNVLIDDFEINTVPWERNGGLPVIHHHESTSSTIKLVEEIIEDATA